MVLYNGDNTHKGKLLFRSAIMDSGSIVPANPVDCPRGHNIYKTVVKKAGCSGASDTLACLHNVDYETFLKATISIPGAFDYQSVALAYLPQPDGIAVTPSPDFLTLNGQFASVPFIIGDQEDEGTLFSLVQSNIITTDQLVEYLSTVFFPKVTADQAQQLVATYLGDLSAGSLHNTSLLNEIYPQYKRVASILGNHVFILTCRVFLNYFVSANPSIPSWSYLASCNYGTPVLGTFYPSDILTTYDITSTFASASIQQYYINFFNTMVPNDSTQVCRVDYSGVKGMSCYNFWRRVMGC